MAEKPEEKIEPGFEYQIRKRFTRLPKKDYERMIVEMQNWILNSNRYSKTIRELLDNSARTIYRLFGFREISIGVRDQNDGLYKYVTVFGFTNVAEKAQRETTYTFDEYWSYEDYPGIKLSSMSDFCIADIMKDAYNRPLKLSETRKSMDDFLEGDYINISIYDSKVQLIAWMELAKSKDEKIPTNEQLLWIELFSSIMGIMIERVILSLNALKK